MEWFFKARWWIFAAATVLCAAQIYQFAWSPPKGRDPMPPHWLDLRFAEPQCGSVEKNDAQSAASPWTMHGDERGRRSTCVSEPLVLGSERFLVIQYAGNPTDRRVHALLRLHNGLSIPLSLGNAARHGWLVSFTELPIAARNQAAQLVIEDASDKPFGYVKVRRLGQSDHKLFSPTTSPLLPDAWAALIAPLLILLGACGFWRARPTGVALLFAGVMLLLLRFRVFYHWDDYALLSSFSHGISLRALLHYNGHLEPVFLSLYASAIWLFRDAYACLQAVMVFAHVVVVLLLMHLLRSHGFNKLTASTLAALYAVCWVHVDVAVWFLELSFLLTTVLALWALLSAARFAKHRRGLGAAYIATAIAPFVFTGGLVVGWLVALYLALFSAASRRAIASFVLLAAMTLAFVLYTGHQLGNAAPLPHVGILQRLTYLAAGTVSGSFMTLLTLRGDIVGTAIVLTVMLALAFYSVRKHRWTTKNWREILFGAAWLVAAYVLQAAVRADLGIAQALSFRYAYFGMTGAAFMLAAWATALRQSLAPLLSHSAKRGALLLLGAIVLTIALVDGHKMVRRIDMHEREFFEINYQQYCIMRAQGWPAAGAENVPVVKSLHPQLVLSQYAHVVGFLSGAQIADDGTAGQNNKPQVGWSLLQPPYCDD